MDYFANPAQFLCLLQDYLAKGVKPALAKFYQEGGCPEYLRTTEQLLTSLQVLSLLEAQVQLKLSMLPAQAITHQRTQQQIVITYTLSLMDLAGSGIVAYELEDPLLNLADCSTALATIPTLKYRVRSVNGKPIGANKRFVATTTALIAPSTPPTPLI